MEDLLEKSKTYTELAQKEGTTKRGIFYRKRSQHYKEQAEKKAWEKRAWALQTEEVKSLIKRQGISEEHFTHLVTLSEVDNSDVADHFHNFFSNYGYPDEYYPWRLQKAKEFVQQRKDKNKLSEYALEREAALIKGYDSLITLFDAYKDDQGRGRITCYDIVRVMEDLKKPVNS